MVAPRAVLKADLTAALKAPPWADRTVDHSAPTMAALRAVMRAALTAAH
jgi:hypothetical protein